MSSFPAAFAELTSREYAEYVKYHPGEEYYPRLTIDQWIAASLDPDAEDGSVQIAIAHEVGQRVIAALGHEFVRFGTFDNCREYGLTFEAGGWMFCVYEHRNSDEICTEGCPVGEVESYGPYGGADKYDVLTRARWQDYDTAAAQLVAMLRFVNTTPDATRPLVAGSAADVEARR